MAKDAYEFGGGGNHFTSYIKDGTLHVRFQDGASSKEFSVGNIKANVDYDLQASFGDGKVTAMLDGKVFGQANFDTSWASNSEYMQIGANGWASQTGQKGFTDVFDGTISNVLLANSNDVFVLHNGNEAVTGTSGADTFVFAGSTINRDVITGYQAGVDQLVLDEALWGGGLSRQQVVDDFAIEKDGNTVFDFDDGNVIVLQGVTGISGLAADIDFL